MSAAIESLARLRAEAAESAAADDQLQHPGHPGHPGHPEWLRGMRDQAFAAFEEQGIPTRRLENWKGTNLAPLAALDFARVGSSDRPGIATPPRTAAELDAIAGADDAPALVFVDGCFDAAASRGAQMPPGVSVRSLAELWGEESDGLQESVRESLARLTDVKRHALVALQTSFLDDGAIVVVEPGTRATQPIRMRFVATTDSQESTESTKSKEPTKSKEQPQAASAAFPRLLVLAGANSEASFFQEHVSIGDAPGLTAFVAEFLLEASARIETVQVQSEGQDRIHFTSTHAHLGRDANFQSHVFSLGDGLVRSELEVTLAEPGGETKMRGFFLGRGKGHIDHFTTVDHAAPHCTSDEEYRGVLGDHSQGVFRGRVIIRPDAQKSDARQSNPNLLISDHARIDSKPQLEIYADDVRASHGSTIGQLDEDALFFLRARGIDTAEARLLLTRAFAHSIVGGISDDGLRQAVAARVDRALESLDSLDSNAPQKDGMSLEGNPR